MSRKLKIEKLLSAVPPSDGIQFPAKPEAFDRYAGSLRALVAACLHGSESLSSELPFEWDPYEQRFTFAVERWDVVDLSRGETPMMLRQRFDLDAKDQPLADEVARFRLRLAAWRSVADAMFRAARAAEAEAATNPNEET